MQKNISLIREIFLFAIGILLIVYSSMNIAISPPPDDITDIPKNYGKTYCLPVESISTNKEDTTSRTKRTIQNAYVLVILALVAGLFITLSSMYGLYQALVSVQRLTSTRQYQRQLQNL